MRVTHFAPICLVWITLCMTAGGAHAGQPHPVMGPMGERNVTILNHGPTSVVELYLSPASNDSWGPDQLGEASIEPGRSRQLKLGRMRDCEFDILVIYDDTRSQKLPALNLCKTRQLVVDGSTAQAAAKPSRKVTVIDNSRLPIQQLFFSPADAAQWGDDLLASSSMSVDEKRIIEFQGDCDVDVRVVFTNRAAEERQGVDLCKNSILHIAPGWTTQDMPAAPP